MVVLPYMLPGKLQNQVESGNDYDQGL